jgi:hypothetical protein
MDTTAHGTLVAVLANPPLTDGKRTVRRVALAAEILGFGGVEITNLFAFASHATGAIGELGVSEEGWSVARPALEASLSAANGILLGYGATSPTGLARVHFRHQVEWLQGRISSRGTRAWHVGDGPRHPSRWQRWTSRAHPDVPFPTALGRSLTPVWITPGGHSPDGLCDTVTVRSGGTFNSPADSEGRVKTCRSAS